MTLRFMQKQAVKEIFPGALYCSEAAKYIHVSPSKLLNLVNRGKIPYRHHIDSTRRIYLVADLDRYLLSLPENRGNMTLVEDSPVAPDREEALIER